MVASRAAELLYERVLRVVPPMACLGNEGFLSFFRDVIVEVGVDGSIDSRPRHASSPEVF